MQQFKEFEWDSENTSHVGHHGVQPEEVEKACSNRPFILKGRGGLYLVYSQTEAGRYLLIVIRYRGHGIIRAITARDLTDSEKKLCQRNRR